MDFKISDFQTQLTNTLNNIHHPDAAASKLVKEFITASNPTADSFNQLVTSLNKVAYSSPKAQANFSPVINLLTTQQLQLTIQNLESNKNVVAPASSGEVSAIECIGSKKSGFSLESITSCKDFSSAATDSHYLYLTLTGDVSGCKGPYDAVYAYYYCEMGS